jgi:hypothetical protein
MASLVDYGVYGWMDGHPWFSDVWFIGWTAMSMEYALQMLDGVSRHPPRETLIVSTLEIKKNVNVSLSPYC